MSATNVVVRRAQRADVPAVIELFAQLEDGNPNDEIVTLPLAAEYAHAFDALEHHPDNYVIVAEVDGQIVGALQITFLQHLAYRGGIKAQVENVHVRKDHRSRRIGESMMRWAIDEARRRGCARMQLTSTKTRARAHAFYARLGFVASHEGFKLRLQVDAE